MKFTKDNTFGKTCLVRFKDDWCGNVCEVHVLDFSPSGYYLKYRKVNAHEYQWIHVDKVDLLDILK
jgi:hypothetical protein